MDISQTAGNVGSTNPPLNFVTQQTLDSYLANLRSEMASQAQVIAQGMYQTMRNEMAQNNRDLENRMRSELTDFTKGLDSRIDGRMLGKFTELSAQANKSAIDEVDRRINLLRNGSAAITGATTTVDRKRDGLDTTRDVFLGLAGASAVGYMAYKVFVV